MTRTSWPADHVVHMSLDHSDRAQSISVARCDCGFEFRVKWPYRDGAGEVQDQAIELHWQRVEKLNPQLDLQFDGR
jgi:predicted transposase YbfD/YdcC